MTFANQCISWYVNGVSRDCLLVSNRFFFFDARLSMGTESVGLTV